MKRILQQFHQEKGAVIVEATISLTAFMFAMFTLLFVVRIAYTQAKMTIALQAATKEVAEYTHIYYAAKLDQYANGGNGKSSEVFQYLSELASEVSQAINPISADLSTELSELSAALGNSSLTEIMKQEAGRLFISKLAEKNLRTSESGSVDAFYNYCHLTSKPKYVVDNFLNGGKDIFIHAEYTVQVIQLLNVDVEISMASCAYTQAWGGD